MKAATARAIYKFADAAVYLAACQSAAIACANAGEPFSVMDMSEAMSNLKAAKSQLETRLNEEDLTV